MLLFAGLQHASWQATGRLLGKKCRPHRARQRPEGALAHGGDPRGRFAADHLQQVRWIWGILPAIAAQPMHRQAHSWGRGQDSGRRTGVAPSPQAQRPQAGALGAAGHCLGRPGRRGCGRAGGPARMTFGWGPRRLVASPWVVRPPRHLLLLAFPSSRGGRSGGRECTTVGCYGLGPAIVRHRLRC